MEPCRWDSPWPWHRWLAWWRAPQMSQGTGRAGRYSSWVCWDAATSSPGAALHQQPLAACYHGYRGLQQGKCDIITMATTWEMWYYYHGYNMWLLPWLHHGKCDSDIITMATDGYNMGNLILLPRLHHGKCDSDTLTWLQYGKCNSDMGNCDSVTITMATDGSNMGNVILLPLLLNGKCDSDTITMATDTYNIWYLKKIPIKNFNWQANCWRKTRTSQKHHGTAGHWQLC